MTKTAAQTPTSGETTEGLYGRPSVAARLGASRTFEAGKSIRGADTEGRPYIGFVLLVCLAPWVLAACRPADSKNAARYDLKGKVVSFDKSAHQVTVAHEDIPGFMPAMTMPFTVKDEWVYGDLSEGDRIQATLAVAGSKSWLEDVVISRVESAGADSTKVGLHLPESGDLAPNFSLVDQDGRQIHTRDYLGRALLITFIYTRCPVPDYCPLMTANFAAIDRELAANSSLASRTHLISISIDPGYDSPKVLRAYGSKFGGSFVHWEFATGTPDQVKVVANWFGLSYWPENGQIIHALSTALIGPDGNLVKLYRGNEWKVDEVLNDTRNLLARENGK